MIDYDGIDMLHWYAKKNIKTKAMYACGFWFSQAMLYLVIAQLFFNSCIRNSVCFHEMSELARSHLVNITVEQTMNQTLEFLSLSDQQYQTMELLRTYRTRVTQYFKINTQSPKKFMNIRYE